MIKLVAFLGNPGADYEKTRHNLGWMVASQCSLIQSVTWQKKFKGVYATLSAGGEKFFLLKPETYMNKSGESVQALMQFFKVSADELMVVHDELELDFGQIDFKKGGGLSGHNGLRSIANTLGTNEFYRYRLGISKPSKNVADFVLKKFSTTEQEVLGDYLNQAGEALEYALREGISSAQKRYKKFQTVP